MVSDELKSDIRESIMQCLKCFNSAIISAACTFMYRHVMKCDPRVNKCSKLGVLPVSVRDEIKIDGFGMALIELLVLVNILKKIDTIGESTKWEL